MGNSVEHRHVSKLRRHFSTLPDKSEGDELEEEIDRDFDEVIQEAQPGNRQLQVVPPIVPEQLRLAQPLPRV